MKDRIQFGTTIIEYDIIRSKRRKTSEIIVNKNGIQVRTPATKNDTQIKKMVDDRKQWIFRKQLEFADKQKPKRTKKPVTEKYLQRRTLELASKIGVKPSKIIIKKLKSKWGSATKNDVVTLNSALVNVPREVIDYVVIHELCHLVIRNHSYKFWGLVGNFMKNYSRQKKWLDVNGILTH